MTLCVRAEASNRVVHLIGDYPNKELLHYWSYSVPNFKFMQGRFRGWDGRIKLLKDNRLPSGLFWATRKTIEDELGLRFKVTGRSCLGVGRKDGLASDRAYQNTCVDRMLARIRFGGGLVLNATGSGKTRIAGLFSSHISSKLCFVVDQLDLLEQAQAELADTMHEEIGYVGKSVYSPRRITVATIQTIARHIDDPKFIGWFESVEIIIIDEIHVQMNRSNFKVIETIEPKAVFGLTATLELRKKDIRLKAFSIAGPVCFDYPLEEGQAAGVLSQGVVIRVIYPNLVEED